MNKNYLIKKSRYDYMIQGLLSALYPNKCLFCKKIMDILSKNTCADCEAALQFNGGFGNDIFKDISEIYAAYNYSEEVSAVIYRFKYEGKKTLALPIAHSLHSSLKDRFINADFLLPVPLHKSRLKQRGYNQAAVLAAELGVLMKMPVCDGMLRIKNTKRQFDLGPEERLQNVADAFALKNDFDVTGKDVILIDDILTTGATASQCAKTLKQAGVGSVRLIVFSAITFKT